MFRFDFIKPISRVVFAIVTSVLTGMCIGVFCTMLDYHDYSRGTKVFAAIVMLIAVFWGLFLSYMFKTTVFEDKHEKFLQDKINSIYTDID